MEKSAKRELTFKILYSGQINKEINGSIFLHRLLKSYNFKLLRYFVVHIIIHPPGEENIW